MPAFTFEKLPPPAAENTSSVAAPKQRGRVIQMLDRFVERRIQHTLGDQPHDDERRDGDR